MVFKVIGRPGQANAADVRICLCAGTQHPAECEMLGDSYWW